MSCAFSIFQLPRSAPQRIIRKQYLRLMLTVHPDRAGLQSTEQAQLVTWANRMIGTEDARAHYETQLHEDGCSCCAAFREEDVGAEQDASEEQDGVKVALPTSLLYPPHLMVSPCPNAHSSVLFVVAVGPESAGKSTLLNRLLGAPLFAVARARCTRMVIEVRLRTSADPFVSADFVRNDQLLSHQVQPAPDAANLTDLPISQVATLLIQRTEHLAQQDAFDETQRLVLTILHPSLPNISLIDTPGATSDAHSEVTRRIAQTCLQLTQEQRAQTGGRLLLLMLHNMTSPHSSNAAISHPFMLPKHAHHHVAVLMTKCDVRESDQEDLERAMRQERSTLCAEAVARLHDCNVSDLKCIHVASRTGRDQTMSSMEAFEQAQLGTGHGVRALLAHVSSLLGSCTQLYERASAAGLSDHLRHVLGCLSRRVRLQGQNSAAFCSEGRLFVGDVLLFGTVGSTVTRVVGDSASLSHPFHSPSPMNLNVGASMVDVMARVLQPLEYAQSQQFKDMLYANNVLKDNVLLGDFSELERFFAEMVERAMHAARETVRAQLMLRLESVLQSWAGISRKSLTMQGYFTSAHCLYGGGVDDSWVGALVTGAGIAPGTRVTSVQGTQVWISKSAQNASHTQYTLKLERGNLQAELDACRADALRVLDGVLQLDATTELPAELTRVDVAGVGLPPLCDEAFCIGTVHTYCRSLFPMHIIRQQMVQSCLVRPLTRLFEQESWTDFEAAARDRNLSHLEETALFERWRSTMRDVSF